MWDDYSITPAFRQHLAIPSARLQARADQLGRAYAIIGNIAEAKIAYQDFFTLWKDADPYIPVLKQAKAEYAKL